MTHPDEPATGLFTPDTLDIAPRHLRVGDDWIASFAITGYPREVSGGWLQPILAHPGRVDVSVHIHPLAPAVATERLRRHLARLESGRRHTAAHGRLPDPDIDTATSDAHDLAASIARGEGRLFQVGLYLTVHAESENALAEEISALRVLCSSLLLEATPTTYRALQGWVSCLPLGMDRLDAHRTFDTAALAAMFPFTSPEPPTPDPTDTRPRGVFYGLNLGSPSLVHHDRFAQDNYNTVVLGRSGSGKSYLVKLDTLRHLYHGVQVSILDPEDEYDQLCQAVGGTRIALGEPGVHVNPLDLPVHTQPDGTLTAPPDGLSRRSLFCHTLLGVLFDRSLDDTERTVLDHAVRTAYERAGITEDRRTWRHPAPLLGDVRTALAEHSHASAHGLADALRPYVDGAFSGLFSGRTTSVPEGHLQVFSLRGLPDELLPVGTVLALDALWHQVTHPATRTPRIVVVDEAWQLLHTPEGARFLFRLAKSARKHWTGLTVASQDVADVLGSDKGTAVIANATTQILLRQAPQVADRVADAFGLSAGERHFLLTAETGQALLATGTHRVATHILASDYEHALITTDPAELEPDTATGHYPLSGPRSHGPATAHAAFEQGSVHNAQW